MNALTRLLLLAVAGVSLFSTGCATVMSERRYPVVIDNTPGPTYFSVYDRKNNVIQQGVTPQKVTLDAKAFPFWPAKYTVVMAGNESTSQKQELKAGIDPWVAGNILIGGGAGAIIDGATGAMFKLPPRVEGSVASKYTVLDPQLGSMIASNTIGTSPDTVSLAQPQLTQTQTPTQVMPASAVTGRSTNQPAYR